MRKRSLISALFVFLLSLLLVSTFKTEVLAQATPKVAIVSLEHVPFVAGDNNEFYISAKNYTGQVQYQLFYIQESVMKEWKLINNADMVNGWTTSIGAQTPIIVDISNLDLKPDKYRFAIRVRRVGVKGLYQNKYGDYDDAYPFNVDVVKNANIELSGKMEIGKTEFTQDEILTISGVDNTSLTVEYKLHLFDVKNNKWLTNLTDYNMNVKYSLKNIPEGTYIVDLWAKNIESNSKYDGWKLKVITINNSATGELTAKQISGRYGNAVVYIEVSDINHETIGTGSGFIVNSNGVIATNFHVIEGASYAKITLQNGTKYDVKSVLNYNEKQDIAILQLANATNLSVVQLGNSDTVEIGDNVVAIGSPQGYENTLSMGIISGINRKNSRGIDFQTTASITQGSSGGALFNMYGNLIGITYSGYDSAGDLGFVIPINEVKPFLSSNNEKTLIDIKNEMYPSVVPTNVSAWAISSSEINIQWDSSQNVDGYYLYYSEDLKTWDFFSDESYNKALLKWYSDYSATLLEIEPNTKIYFRVSAVINGIEGDKSEVIDATTLNARILNEDDFFPLLSDVPMPTDVGYYNSSLSDDSTYVFYFFSSLPDSFFDDYFSLLENNGWEFYKEDTDSNGLPLLHFSNGENVITFGWLENDLVIFGDIH